jgi:hypothetical protein
MICTTFHAEDPQVLGAAIQKQVTRRGLALGTWAPLRYRNFGCHTSEEFGYQRIKELAVGNYTCGVITCVYLSVPSCGVITCVYLSVPSCGVVTCVYLSVPSCGVVTCVYLSVPSCGVITCVYLSVPFCGVVTCVYLSVPFCGVVTCV